MYVLVLLFLHGFLTDSCNGCTTGTFSFNNECRPCPENSSSCDSETACNSNSCKIGYHGETCSLACPQHCHDDECEKTSGTCFSCRKGYYGGENKTCIKCQESCATCRSNSYCFACKSGYKGDFCSNCKERTSCDKKTGYCLDSCRNGLSGELCDKKCDVKCKSCVRRNNNECTTCALDKYGTNCNENCSKNECYDSDGVCTNGCSEGYWGTMCESLSSVNCNNSVCMIQNGTCLGGCIEDYYEHNCSKEHNSTHARHFGLVVGLVIGGALAIIIVAMCTCYFKRKHLSRRFKWLHALDERPFLCCRCFYKEQHNKDKHNDEMDVVSKTLHTSSEPTNEVNSLDKNENESLLPAGKLRIEKDGTPCNNPNERFQSSNGGKYKTNANDGRNARMYCNGTAMTLFLLLLCVTETCNSCRAGQFFDKDHCKQCPENCVYCVSETMCSLCTSGYHGESCSLECSNCEAGTDCDKYTGYCINSCKEGLSGEHCNMTCFPHCKSCDRLNRNECINCTLDRHGIFCNKTCSSTCLKGMCNDSNGVCTYGCLRGYWGQTCENSCSTNCKNVACTTHNGTCLEGCVDGYYEHNCSKAHYKAPSGYFQYVGGPIIAVVVVIIVVFVFACYKKRWYSQIPCRKPKIAQDVANALKKSCNWKFKRSSQTFATETNTEEKTETVSMLPVDESRLENDGDISSVKDGPNTRYEDKHSNTLRYISIDRYKTSRTYIVSYGPTKALKEIAFWKKIWELQCEIIVMITTVHDSEILKIEENKIPRVLQQDNNLTVIIEQGQSNINYTKLPVTIQMNQAKSLAERKVTLFAFFAWHDVGIPDNVESFLEFHKKVGGSKTILNGPTLVHCSVGLHRCETYVAFDMLQSTKRSLSRNDIQLCLEHLKKHGPETTLEQMDHLSQMLEMSRNSHN